MSSLLPVLRHPGRALSVAALVVMTLALSVPAYADTFQQHVDRVPSHNSDEPAEIPIDVTIDRSGINPAPPLPPISGAPALGTSFEGPNFDTNIGTTGGNIFIPPDPHGAAGPNHVVSVINVGINWYTKPGGVQQQNISLRNFFAPLAPTTFTFDPKVIYDQHAGRFVVITLERVATPQISRILIAVSDDSDPNGIWYFQAINSAMVIGGVNRFADYPGLGVDNQALYITNNMFGFTTGTFGGVGLWIVNKAALYAGGVSAVTVHRPDLVGDFTMQPAHVFGTVPGGEMILVSSGWSTDGSVGNGSGSEALSITRVINPLGAVSFSQQFLIGPNIENALIGMPDAPQINCPTVNGNEALPVNSPVETNDRRALNAVWRNNNLYVADTIRPETGPDAGDATAHWWRVNTTNLPAMILADQGSVGAEDLGADTFTFMGSVMVDAWGNMAYGFSASNSTIHPGAFYTGRLAGAPAGTVQPTGTLAAGTDCYRRTFCGTRNRWGDYSGLALCPTDQGTFWVFNEYAMTRGTATACGAGGTLLELGRWATRWGSFALNRAPVAICQDIQVQGDSTVVCTNTSVTAADVNNGSYDPDGDPVTLTLVPAGPYTLGVTNVKLIVTDPCGAADTCDATVTVDCPVPVKLTAFNVARVGDGAQVSWSITDAVDHAGFHVYREVAGTDRVRISDTMLSGRSEYVFEDADAPVGEVNYWLAEISRAGQSTWHGPMKLAAAGIRTNLVFAPGHPNPFRANTTFSFSLPEAQQVRMTVFDTQGRQVRALLDGLETAGSHTVAWNGRRDDGAMAAAGFYMVRLEAGNEVKVQKIVLAR